MAQINESMDEGLKKLLRQISDLMIIPDADLEFLTSLQSNITNYTREKATALATAQTGVGGGSSIGGLMPGGQPQQSPMAGMGGNPGGGINAGPMAAQDLQRLLTAGSAGG